MLKTARTFLSVAIAVVALSTPSAYAGCRTAYLQQIDNCSGGFFEVQGCYQDANIEYFACVGRAALG